MAAILKTENLAFGTAIRYPDLAIEPGVVTFIAGPSGCGKTTLLHLFNATLTPTAGDIFYAGRDIAGLDTIRLRREVLLMCQSAYLFDGDIRRNFTEYHLCRGEPAPADDDIRRWLAVAGADFPPERDCRTLSGGERQRIYLAITLSLRPRVLLLDEPTAALDGAGADALLAGLVGHCRAEAITPVIVSHQRALVDRYAESTITLHRGGRA